MTRVRVRRAQPADLPALLALERHFPSDRLSARSLRRFLAGSTACVLVADGGTALAGALVLLTRRRARVARIYSVVVDPAHRGLGLGARLVRAAEAAARRRGCREVRLEVRTGARAARRLYLGLGYLPRERLPRYYADGADGLRLGRRLRPPM